MTMMACGHAANATCNGEPACVICAGTPEALIVADAPNLTGRIARCSCGEERPSSTALAFFEYRGPGSRDAAESCIHCRYAKVAHEYGGCFAPPSTRRNPHLCLNFDPPREFENDPNGRDDIFYCGHAGWN